MKDIEKEVLQKLENAETIEEIVESVDNLQGIEKTAESYVLVETASTLLANKIEFNNNK